MKILSLILALSLLAALISHGQSPSGSLRTWTDQDGRTLKAAWVGNQSDHVMLRLENGATVQVPLARLSGSDQFFIRQISRSGPPMDRAQPAVESAPVALVWPETVTVDAKNLQITMGEQDAAARRYVYRSGTFQFESQAPLTGTVMREIAGDFELVNTLFTKLPWAWQPKPRNGQPFFLAKLHETEEDYIRGGGADNTSGGSTNEYVFTKFSALGLKRVGERYAFDAKSRKEGPLVSLITRLIVGDMSIVSLPWSGLGIEEFMEYVAYRNGTFDFSNPSRALRTRVEERISRGYIPDAGRMITFLHTPWDDYRGDSAQLRLESYLDGMMLMYFFGFLDDDGKGGRLHHYFHSLSRDALEYRRFQESGGTQRMSWSGKFADRAAELNKIVIGNRTDEELKEAMVAKFKQIGVKL